PISNLTYFPQGENTASIASPILVSNFRKVLPDTASHKTVSDNLTARKCGTQQCRLTTASEPSADFSINWPKAAIAGAHACRRRTFQLPASHEVASVTVRACKVRPSAAKSRESMGDISFAVERHSTP